MRVLDKEKEMIVLCKDGEYAAVCSNACGVLYSRGFESTGNYDPDIPFGCVHCGEDLIKGKPLADVFNFCNEQIGGK